MIATDRGHGTKSAPVTVEVPVDVGNATSAVRGLWDAVPAERPAGGELQSRPTSRAGRDRDGFADPLEGFAVPGYAGLACHEQAFHYLLDIERRRSASTQRPFLLMLIDCEAGTSASVRRRLERLFPIVCRSVRETDFTGWYCQGAAVGAALTLDGRGATQAHQIIRERIVKAFEAALPLDLVSRLRLHLFEVVGNDDRRIE
jgi:hypothetical protein